KCRFDSGYINGDIRKDEIKQRIYLEIQRWQKLGNDRVDVVIATPPCQGMSVANHKKKENEIERNSLVVESVNMIKNICPYFFILENVQAFWKTGCTNNQGKVIAIGDLILAELATNYKIEYRIINFKNYGSNSSRTRTLVIGVDKNLSYSPSQFFPDERDEVTLKQVIGNMKSLNWGEYDDNDFYHSFRVYPENMRAWITDIKQGQSAFDNVELNKRPHKIVNGKIVLNKSKNGDKYTRQLYDKVAPCIHTRNDQLASQNTVHPIEDRVFSIRELMKLMTIPDQFKWIDISLETLNNLPLAEKQKISKKNEMNIRQSIGEAVPTAIFKTVAEKIKQVI
ncbi:DNA cytosine methyltransferase, partial [Gilliamella sp. wkB292]|uniref:DNA cytosine methyltransferase n=1 Tax=Gilliamella sp. wkB292 TaxID=3120262 RepID=UPI000AB90548